jgi:hypothetical protein
LERRFPLVNGYWAVPVIAWLLLWMFLWVSGGILFGYRAFRLLPREWIPIGLAVGLAFENILANLVGRFFPLPIASWMAAGVVFLAGVLTVWIGMRTQSSFWITRVKTITDWLNGCGKPALVTLLIQVAILAGLTILFTLIGRGTAIFDDYAHLPVLSMLATGDIPPHFPLNPGIPYNYHYFLLFFAAQLVRLGDIFPWMALDFSRAFTLALGVLLMVVWAQRLTRSWMAGILAAVFLLLGTGTRWIFLLLPSAWVETISTGLQMLGSGAASGKNFSLALWHLWGIDGGPPIPFPFAFVSGILHPGVLGVFGPNGLAQQVFLLSMLLTFDRWKGWQGGFILLLWSAALALLGESTIVLSLLALGIITVYALIKFWRNRVDKFSFHQAVGGLWIWWLVLPVGSLLGSLQGGAMLDTLRMWLQPSLMGMEGFSYQTMQFTVALSPAIVSAHLGELSLLNPGQLLVALFEIGPVLIALPLIAIWGWKALQHKRWYEAIFILSGLLSLGLIFIRFVGSPGVRNTSRLYGFVMTCVVYALPLFWIWLRGRRLILKFLLGMVGLTFTLGGVVILFCDLSALSRPIYAEFITDLDARMMRCCWNRLEPGSVVFDPTPWRAPTILGRPTNSSLTWFEKKAGWLELYDHPDPSTLHNAGFSYFYFDREYWEDRDPNDRKHFDAACVVQVAEFVEPATGDYRRLLDIRTCHP